MTTVFINGKFTAQRTTGVQRVASQLVLALDRLLEGSPAEWVLLCPAEGVAPPLVSIQLRTVGVPGLPLHVWEQLVLPWAAREGLLINLAGAAPAFARRQWALLHDAAIFDHPEAYAPAFVAWYRWLFHRLARHAERLFTVSAFSRGRLARSLGIAEQRFTLICNGADHLAAVQPDDTVLHAHGLLKRPFLLAVGSANPTKNMAALMEALTLLQRPDLRLVIVGSSNELVFAGMQAAPDPQGVLRLGHQSDAALKALYRAAQAFVFPSTYEGFGLPPLEAMAEGCPVAVAWVAALPEVCGDGALPFDPHSPHAIAEALRRLLDDQALRSALQLAGRIRAARFSWDRSAALLMNEVHP